MAQAQEKRLPELKPQVLIVDDDESMRDLLLTILKDGYDCYPSASIGQARDILQHHDIQVVLLDVRLKEENGLDFLPEIFELNDQIEVIVITVISDVSTAVRAMKNGAFDYINKDFDSNELTTIIERALDKQQSTKEILYLRDEIRQQEPDDYYIGSSPQMLKAREIADRAAPLPTTVLITGETGTGKELMARYIHSRSHLADKPFVTVNLSSIPAELMESILFGHEKGSFTGAHQMHYGKFELANGGTLFLDEIGELRFELQAKLLRVLQESEIERVGSNKMIPIRVRLIVATNADLQEKVLDRSFRDDLYYRLNVVPILMPPLRDRIVDIGKLIDLFLSRYNRKFNRNVKALQPDVIETISSYDWPGNIRELENLIERIVAISNKETVGFADVPIEYQLCKVENSETSEGEELLQKSLDAFERSFLLRILEEESWNQSQAAKRLGIHRKTLEYKIKRLDLGEIIQNERSRSHT